MKLLSLNCRGLGNPEIVHELQLLLKLEVPQVVFLMETRLDIRSVEWLRVKLKMKGALGVDRDYTGGGLALLWSEEVEVRILSFSRRHINAKVVPPNSEQWRFTDFYDNPEAHLRMESWNLIRHLAILNPLPWMVCGDFNEITEISEKLGNRGRTHGLMQNFREALSDSGLLDLGYSGPKFTWCNMQGEQSIVFARLDRGVSNRESVIGFDSILTRR
jgi:hypothetical protein